MKSNLRYVFVLFLSIYSTLYACFTQGTEAKTVLTITGNGQNSLINSTYLKTVREFERQYPNTKVKLQLQPDQLYKDNLTHTLSTQSNTDIVIMHAGERLNNVVKNRKILPITDLWQQYNLNQSFSLPIRRMVTHKNDLYAVPFSSYLWGFYYKKSLFQKLQIIEPKTWKELVRSLNTIKNNEIAPIFIGTKNSWPIGCWFEYINLRLNGLDFHRKFVAGEIDSYSKEITQVLQYLKQLVDADFFYRPHKGKTLTDGLALLLREKSGIVLAGGAYENFLPDSMKKDVGFFAFPQIAESMPAIQVAPVDVMAISANSRHPNLAKEFLLFMANKNVQTNHNMAINQVPVNIHSSTLLTGTSKLSFDILKAADGITLFYDREVEKKYGLDNLAIWKGFLDNPSIKDTQERMELARLAFIARRCSVVNCDLTKKP